MHLSFLLRVSFVKYDTERPVKGGAGYLFVVAKNHSFS